MELKDLKKEIIYQTYWNDKDRPTIFCLREDGKSKILHYIYESRMFRFNAPHSHLNDSEKNTKLATLKQKQWFNACVKVGKYIEFKDIKFKTIHELWY